MRTKGQFDLSFCQNQCNHPNRTCMTFRDYPLYFLEIIQTKHGNFWKQTVLRKETVAGETMEKCGGE